MKAYKNIQVLFSDGESREEGQDDLVLEEALQIILNQREFLMTMRTPGADRYLIRGLMHSSDIETAGIVSYEEELLSQGSCARVQIAEQVLWEERQLMATSSCGVCGERNLDKLYAGLRPVERNFSFDPAMIPHCYGAMAEHQLLFEKTGGVHAAAAFRHDGTLLCVFEDIGRHNAVDKVIGYLLENSCLAEAAILAVSSRLSYEIVQKCIRAGLPVLLGISAPSSLAVEMARSFGLLMAAFCRGDKATFYAGEEGLKPMEILT